MGETGETALAVVSHGGLQTAFEPRSFGELQGTCTVLYRSGLLPKAVGSVEAACYIAMRGRELGLTLGQSFASINIIDGKTVLASDLIVARIRRSGRCKLWHVEVMTSVECTIVAQRTDDVEPTRLTWKLDDAAKAGLTNKQNWRNYPRAMLRARCQAELARTVFPDEALGMYDPDELDPPEHVHVDARVIAEPSGVEGAPVQAEIVPPREPSPGPGPRKASDVARELAVEMKQAGSSDALDAIRARYKAMPFRAQMMDALEEHYRECFMVISRLEDGGAA